MVDKYLIDNYNMPTMAEVMELQEVVVEALKESAEVHSALGESGKEPIQKNQFGETALRADWEAEETILNYLKQQKVPIRVISEEHGVVEVCKSPLYLGILDGIDGTNPYKAGNGRYGTMFGIFKGTDPYYHDYLVSGILEYPSTDILIASKGEGAFVLSSGIRKPISSSMVAILDHESTKIYVDGYFEVNIKTFEKQLRDFKHLTIGRPGVWGASSIYYADLVRGRVDLVGECTRKKNLEIAIAYGLIKEAGGVMVDEQGEDLGSKRYLEFGQKEDEHLPVLSAASFSLAQKLISL